MIGEQASLVPAHAEVVDEQAAGGGGVLGGIEGAFEGRAEGGDVFVEVADFACNGADELGLVGREVWEGLGALSVLDLGVERVNWRWDSVDRKR